MLEVRKPPPGSPTQTKDVSQMAALLVLAVIALVAVLAPQLGTDTTDARSEHARPDRGWWPAGPTSQPRPRH
jgi:hypothetical protein